MNWINRVKETIFPLSNEQSDIRKALDEWHYTGATYDLELAVEDCQLCGHQNIRYQFEIENRETQNSLLIGSECITRFDIRAVDQDDRTLGAKETRKIVSSDRRKLINDSKKKRLVSYLLRLKQKDQEFEIDSFINYYSDRNAFTPSQLSTLLWRLKKHGINFNPNDFKMTIRRNREKDQLVNMEEWKVKKLWLCMSPAQKKFYEENND